MIDKSQAEHLITAFLNGRATEKERLELETWVKADPEHARYFQKEKNIWQGLHPAFYLEEFDVLKAEKKLTRQINGSNPVRKIFIYWQRIAAILIIPLIVFSTYLFFESKDYLYEEIQYQELIAPYGMHSQVNLPDGSKVWLNGGSSLKYPINFKQGKRNVMLNGEGYFEVQSDKKNPFIVVTKEITLTATGTAFNIEAYDIDSTTAITMVEGKIDVVLNRDEDKTSISMKPGERALWNNYTHKSNIHQTEPYRWYAWKDGMMIFRDDPLSYVFKRLALTFNIHIDLKDKELADAPYRATFQMESLDEILRLLEMSAPLRFVHKERSQIKDNQYEKQYIEVYKKNISSLN